MTPPSNTSQSEVSKCCKTSTHIYSSGEGTNHYVCNGCGEPCDLASWNFGSDTHVTTKTPELPTIKEVVQQMLLDYTAWCDGAPVAWNIKKRKGLAQLDAIIQREREEAVKEARIDELEMFNTNYWGNDDVDDYVDIICSPYIEQRIATLEKDKEET